MSQIQSNVGLVTGLPILDTVDKIIAASAKPRDLLKSRNEGLQAHQLALSQLSTLLLGVRFEISKLKSADPFQSRVATSSAPDVLSATVADGARPAVGNYNFTPVQTASAQQLLSRPLGPGAPARGLHELSLQFGGFLDADIPLARLNDGAGVAPGAIRITDRSGATAVVDLRYARSLDDVLNSINAASDISVKAVAEGDRLRIEDRTGQTASNLIVSDVTGGTTAADLGLAGIDVASASALGQDVLRLHGDTQLAHLNDGRGVALHDQVEDLEVTLRDGTSLRIDLGAANTLDDVLKALNAADPSKLQAAISADGDHLQLSDLTSGGGAFAVTSTVGSTAAEDLGLTGPSFGGRIVSRRLQAGLGTTLLTSLHGGQGTGALGALQLTDRSGQTATVDLLAAETVDDVLAAINGAGVGIQASLNATRSGIALQDTTGATASNLIVASGDAAETAEALGIAVDDAVDRVESGPLNRQIVGHATRLEDFGGGVAPGSFVIRNSNGKEGAVRLNNPAAVITTVGGVLDAINALDLDVEARINDRGDGLLLIDRAGGTGTLSVREVGTGTTAADLRLTRAAISTELDGNAHQAIDGSTRESFDVARHLSLASIGADGVQSGRFTIRDSSGKAAEVVVDIAGGEARTLGDVIDAINAAEVAVEARVNDTGDGLLLIDRAGGPSTLEVTDAAGKTTAQDLGIAGGAGGGGDQFIDGAGAFDSSRIDADALGRLVDEIRSRQFGVSASTIFDGTGYRLALSVDETGAGRELLADSKGGTMQFAETAPTRDAVVHFGVGTEGGFLLSSPTNEFENVVDGVNLSVKAPSEVPVAVGVQITDEDLLGTVEQFVEAYNSLRDSLAKVTSFDEETGATGVLFGTHEVLRIDRDLSNLVSKRFTGLGRFESLQAIGIQLSDGGAEEWANDEGKLTLDSARLQEAFAEDPEALERLFTDPDHGIAAQFEAVIDQLAGEETSLLTSRTDALEDKIQSNADRIEQLSTRLESERERLLKQFFAIEDVVARMQSDLAAVQGIQALPPLSVALGQQTRR